MKLVLFTHRGTGSRSAGVLTDRGVIPLPAYTSLEPIIDQFDALRSTWKREISAGNALPLSEVHVLAPLPRPGKILRSTATYSSQHGAERPQLLFTLKSAESVIGPGETVHLPAVGEDWQFVAEAELGLVMRGPVKRIKAADWRKAVFGFTCVIDVMARGDTQFGRDFWLAKSDTLGPLGPCIVTADEIADPATLRVRSSLNGTPTQDYFISDADYTIGEQLELATTIMTLNTGDVLACGTSRDGLQPLSNADDVRVDIGGIGELEVRVSTVAGVGA
jgi:2-keto-4-pentenoate hydratase/2-oxohepta-3-ene-1,7-dioic acid hydratase in catechol pathway